MLGTTVVYYGDEIGMTGFRDDLKEDATKDPYVAANCNDNNNKTGNCYLLKSRDPMRTPMQVLILFSGKILYNVIQRVVPGI